MYSSKGNFLILIPSRYSETIFDRYCLRCLSTLKDNLPHNTYQIHVKHHPKNTEMTLEYQIFDEKALE